MCDQIRPDISGENLLFVLSSPEDFLRRQKHTHTQNQSHSALFLSLKSDTETSSPTSHILGRDYWVAVTHKCVLWWKVRTRTDFAKITNDFIRWLRVQVWYGVFAM